MNARVAFALALVLASASVVAMAVAIAAGRGIRRVRVRRRQALLERIRPQVLALLDDDDGGEAAIPTSGREWRAAEMFIRSLLPKLRGVDRDALAQHLATNGVLDRARRDTRSRRAVTRLDAAELLGAAGLAVAGRDLRRLLGDRDAEVRMAAARALGRIGDGSAVPDLLASLDGHRVPANTVSMALLRIGAPGADALAAGLHSANPVTQGIAAELLGTIGVVEARAEIEPLLDHPADTVRRSAARALGRLGVPTSTPPIVEHLQAQLALPDEQRDTDTCIALVTALGQIGDRRAIPVLRDSLARSHRLSFAAAAALAAMEPRRSPSAARERPGEPAPEPPMTLARILAGRAPSPSARSG